MDIPHLLREQIVAIAAEGDRVRAILELRRATGWNLDDAKRWLDANAPITAPPPRTVTAALYAIGRYDASISDCTDYSGSAWQALPPVGARISIVVADGSDDDSILAVTHALGIDPFDVATHVIDMSPPLLASLADCENCFRTLDQLRRLHAQGFQFVFHISPASTL